MQDLRVTIIQADQVWQDKKANYAMYETYFEQINNTDLILLPEMFHTGFSMEVKELAEEWETSQGMQFLSMWSKKLNAAIYTSLIIQEKGKYYNRGVFVQPNNHVDIYNKRKLFSLGRENEYYTSGDREVIVDLNGWKINLQICYDLRFPELIRNRILTDGQPAYDVLLYVANWPERRILHWEKLLAARAIENQCFVVGLNRVGTDGNNLEYSGSSMILNSLGEVCSETTAFQNEIISFVLNHEELKTTRFNLPFLRDF
jgi:omega-amidase